MKTAFRKLYPPPEWRNPVIILLGVLCGLGAYALYISRAPSYLSDDPRTCINCHVMNTQYYDWTHSSHRNVATCNDCHVPHDNVFRKYAFKAQDGLRHATIFTMRWEPQVIRIREAGRKVVHENCLRCHERTVGAGFMYSIEPGYKNHLRERSCLDCHRETPHLRVNSLTSAPNALVKTQLKSRTERDEEEEEENEEKENR